MPFFSICARLASGARLKPLPGESSDIASKILVFPAPFAPVNTIWRKSQSIAALL